MSNSYEVSHFNPSPAEEKAAILREEREAKIAARRAARDKREGDFFRRLFGRPVNK